MTQTDKEQIQYLFNQYLEGDAGKPDMVLLFKLMDKENQDSELADIMEELITSETELSSYEPGKWESVVQEILGPTANHQEIYELPTIGPHHANTSTTGENINEDDRVFELKQFKKKWILASSVAAILVLVVAFWFLHDAVGKNTIATQYSQQKKISLPDHSEIVLNAHSYITYSKKWKKGQPREVWLTGEAFFKVAHLNTNSNLIKPGDRFIVYTAKATIEVLGTVFNVRERRGRTEIVLEKGTIKVSFKNSSQPGIIMKPGQIITINDTLSIATMKTIIPEDYIAWTQKKLVLTDASFKEIVEYMEDNFGKHIILSDTSLASRKVEGTFKIDNLDDALFVLSKVLNVDIQQKQDTLFFKSK